MTAIGWCRIPNLKFQITEESHDAVSESRSLCGGDRDGAIKEYDVQAFRFDLPAGIEPMAGLITEWLTVEEWLDPLRVPISPTAVNLLKQAEGEATLAGRSFP